MNMDSMRSNYSGTSDAFISGWARSRRSWVILTLILGLIGCAAAPPKKEKPSQEETLVNGFIVKDDAKISSGARADFAAAVQLLQAQQYQQAIELLGKVINESRNAVAPYINIAIAYGKIGKLELAEENLKKALELKPTHPVASNEYAMLYRKSGRFQEARQLYERTLEKYPEFYPMRKNLGILCDLYLNDLECALEQYEIYKAAMPDDKNIELWIADLKIRAGQ